MLHLGLLHFNTQKIRLLRKLQGYIMLERLTISTYKQMYKHIKGLQENTNLAEVNQQS